MVDSALTSLDGRSSAAGRPGCLCAQTVPSFFASDLPQPEQPSLCSLSHLDDSYLLRGSVHGKSLHGHACLRSARADSPLQTSARSNTDGSKAYSGTFAAILPDCFLYFCSSDEQLTFCFD